MMVGADARIIGITGWSGSGKTTLIIKLLPELVARGLRVATLKHAHHDFDVDLPGKDSYEHRKAGASEVIVASSRRWAQMHELAGETEASLPFLLRRLSPCDLVLIEGYKRDHHPKIEIYRPAVGKPLLQPADQSIVAIASDERVPEATVAVIDLNNVKDIADIIIEKAQSFDAVLNILEKT
jgi:molybdopterin-guanine dinucleotide biosynthesis protein B